MEEYQEEVRFYTKIDERVFLLKLIPGIQPEILKYMNRNDILIETDCPYLTPEPFRGKAMNSPIFARFTIMKIAEIMEISPEELCKITNLNAYRIFQRLK